MIQKFDYSKLRGRIREKYGTDSAFADALEITPAALSQKLNNKAGWNQEEILDACTLLSIADKEAFSYFFAPKVMIS